MINIKTISYKYSIESENEKTITEVININNLSEIKAQKILNDFFNNFKILRRFPSTEQIIQKTEYTDKKPKGKGKLNQTLKFWNEVKDFLPDEFYLKEYVNLIKEKMNPKWNEGSWGTMPSIHINKLIKLNKIEIINNKQPKKYRKIKTEI